MKDSRSWLVAIGLMFVWCSAALYWIPLTMHANWIVQCFGYAMVMAVSAACLTFFVLANSMETRRDDVQRKLDDLQAAYDQIFRSNQAAIAMIDDLKGSAR